MLACACQGGPNYPESPTAVVDVPSAEEPSGTEIVRDAGADVAAVPELSPPFDALGKSCPENERDRPSSLLCDPRNRVSGISTDATASNEPLPLPGARSVQKAFDFGPPPGRSLEVGIAGNLIAVRFVLCPHCSRPDGFTFVGDLSRLTDSELAALQQRIGLRPNVLPLRSYDEWRRAFQVDAGT